METLVSLAVVAFICYVVFQVVVNVGKKAQPRTTHLNNWPQERGEFNPEDDLRADESRCFLLPVVGESHRNPDGGRRQEIIKHCSVGEPVQLVPEPDNPHDSSAIKVCRQDGEQIGYLRSETAYEIGERLERGAKFRTEIFAIHGGTRGKPSRGVVLRVGVLKAEGTGKKAAASVSS